MRAAVSAVMMSDERSLCSNDGECRWGLEDIAYVLNCYYLFTHDINQGVYISRVRDHSKNPKHYSSTHWEKNGI